MVSSSSSEPVEEVVMSWVGWLKASVQELTGVFRAPVETTLVALEACKPILRGKALVLWFVVVRERRMDE